MPDANELRAGLARLQEHTLNEAEPIFRRLLAAEPDNHEVLHLGGITLFKLGRREEGIDLLRRAAAGSEPVAFWVDLAVALRDSGRRGEAEAAYGRAVALSSLGQTGDPVRGLDEQVFSVERGETKLKVIDYEYHIRPRYGAGRPPHPALAQTIERDRARYAKFIDDMIRLRTDFAAIDLTGDYNGSVPFWLNTWFAPLDGMALSTMLCTRGPSLLVEVGSGMSTRFARRAIDRHGLATKLIAIDPRPRNTVAALADQHIQLPLEEVAPEWFDRLGENDILFIDSSHRVFQNSDVTVFFLEVLPRLQPGVVVHVHDVYLPFDYVAGHRDRLWNEQYLLATAFLYGGSGLQVLFPSWYVSQDDAFSARVNEQLRQGPLSDVSLHGTSFWMQTMPHGPS